MTLAALEVELGSHVRFLVPLETPELSLEAIWDCGCRAAGWSFSHLEIATCGSHKVLGDNVSEPEGSGWHA